MEFDWDADKAAANIRKHRVTFEEARTVFEDPNASVQYDDQHSELEDRWRILGLSNRLRLLSVHYTKQHETAIRLISARRANQAEARRYAGEG